MEINTYSKFEEFKKKLKDWLLIQLKNHSESEGGICVFLSVGNEKKRCEVWNTFDENINTVLKRIYSFLDNLYSKNRGLPEFFKIDLAYNISEESWDDVEFSILNQEHNNHYRKGISFDGKFNLCFLEQEIYGKAIIKGISFDKPNFFDEKNLNDAIKAKYKNITKYFKLDDIKKVWVFDTIAAFYEKGMFIDLQTVGVANGIRCHSKVNKAEIKEIIINNAEFLCNQIMDDGRFIYGYFPAYDREIKSYNTVRHCTSLYALLETLEVDFNKKYLDKIERSIEYAFQKFYKIIEEKGFMIDGEQDLEIKLGSNATAIFMLAKYQEITGNDKYLENAEMLAKGIQYMIDEHGQTSHILNYPSLSVKEKFRIVYYDGEAALGLLRLYQINKNKDLLDTVKLMFNNFIVKKYDKYHDHWLSYCTNELTKICPEEKYFRFGMNNYLNHMEFIKNRKTAYATFLEMMMSAYKMVLYMRDNNYLELFNEAKFDELKELIKYRVEFQCSTGFFYPELAMYMARPDKIKNAFFVRHDRFRVRIDDQEHNLSGLVAFYNYFE